MVQRNTILDIAKGVGMILVVIGHLDTPFGRPIYKFHMALFFIISGWCLSDKYINQMLKFTWRRFVSILLPALLLIGLVKVLFLINPAYSDIALNKCHLLGTTWFLKDLFKAAIIFQVLLWVSSRFRLKYIWVWPMILILLAHVSSYFGLLSIALNSYITTFYALGYVLKKYSPQIISQCDVGVENLVVLCIGAGALFMSKNWAPGHITGCNYSNYLIYGLLSLCGSYLTFQFCHIIANTDRLKKWIILIGQNTMPILLLQWPAFSCVDILEESGFVVFEYPLLETCAKFCLGIGLPILASIVFARLKQPCMNYINNKKQKK